MIQEIMRIYAYQTNTLNLKGIRGAVIREVKLQSKIFILRAPWAVIRDYTVVFFRSTSIQYSVYTPN